MKIISGLVKAAGLNRVAYWMNHSDTGTISAFRKYDDRIYEIYSQYEIEEMKNNKDPELDKYTLSLAQNKNRDRRLRTEFKKLRDVIGYIKVDGMYQEAGSPKISKEMSYFVFAIDPNFDLKTFLLEMGKRFNQDSITYAKAGKNYTLYCSTAQKFILLDGEEYSFGEKVATFKGAVMGGDPKSPDFSLEVFSKIRGRPFAWDNYKPYRMEACSFQSEQTLDLNNRVFITSGINLPGISKFTWKPRDRKKYGYE